MSLSVNDMSATGIATLRAHDGSLVNVSAENGETLFVGPDWRVLLDRAETEELVKRLNDEVGLDDEEHRTALRDEYEQGESYGRDRGREDAEEDFSTMAYNALNGPNANPELFVTLMANSDFAGIEKFFGGRTA